jgi:HEAT repeat protein
MRALSLAAVVLALLLVRDARSQGSKKKDKLPAAPQDHVIGDKTLKQWIKEIQHPDPSRKENAIRTIVLFGPELAQQAVPALIGELKKGTLSQPVDTSTRVNVPITLGIILGGLKDHDPKYVHMSDVVSTLTRYLRDTQSNVKYRTAEALGRIGPEARAAIPNLLALLKDPSTWESRMMAANALSVVAFDAEKGPEADVLKGLYGALSDPASQVRLAAIRALTFLGPPQSQNHKVALYKALEPVAYKDRDRSVQIWAMMGLMQLSGEITESRLGVIGKLLDSEEVSVRVEAIHALSLLKAKAKSQVPRIISALGDKSPAVVGAALTALNMMGFTKDIPDRRIEGWAKRLDSDEAAERFEALQILSVLGPRAAKQIPRLIAALEDKEQMVAVGAMACLINIGEEAKVAIPHLQKLLASTKNDFLRQGATQAIKKLEEPPPKKK